MAINCSFNTLLQKAAADFSRARCVSSAAQEGSVAFRDWN